VPAPHRSLRIRRLGPARAGLASIGLLAATAGAVPPTSAVPPDADIATLSRSLSSGTLSAAALTDHYLRRIAALDARGPALHSVLELNPDARAIAAALDRSTAPRGALHGIPVLLKDNVDTGDRLHTTAGSLALLDSRPARDAFIVRRLRASGAVILGKTNLSEWANFRSKRSVSGWSARGGLTLNPYDRGRNACGSSSGSGTAIAADLAVVAVGSETDGSIICPSSVAGLVGIKPTVGLVSRSGIIPISAVQDTAGPMARTVADAAALLGVLAGYDPEDPATAPLKDRPAVDYTKFLDARSLQGARIGVMRRSAGFHEDVDAAFERALAALRAAGATLVDPADLPADAELGPDESLAMSYEFKDGINRYLATRVGPGPHTLADLIAFDEAEAGREMPWFRQELFVEAEARGPLTDAPYVEARARLRRRAATDGLDALMAREHLDALVAPSAGPAWTNDLVNGDRIIGGDVTSAPAIAGYPHVTVPMGFVHGLPVGLSLVGAPFSEGKLIGYAYAFEQATHARRPPALPHVADAPRGPKPLTP